MLQKQPFLLFESLLIWYTAGAQKGTYEHFCMDEKYMPRAIETKWQKIWEEKKTFAADDTEKDHLYILDMFPYPSAAGLHVGHPEGYTASDILTRYWRMRGKTVLHPMGWDAFGLPAENYAIKTKTHPREITKRNIDHMRQQIKQLGFAYDWSREFATTDPEYYKWTQWIFLKLFERGLAYEADVPINWCPKDKTGLANEEVVDGKCERCGTPVTKKKLRQWMLKITAYADRLLGGLDGLDWPEPIKLLQRNWIGRSEGAEIHFSIEGHTETLDIFTTRPDTLFGATYMVLAPEHPLVDVLTTDEQRDAVYGYRHEAESKSDIERQEVSREKTGVFTGTYAVNPVNSEKIPIWVADYVLMGYGTGAIMAVPAHDQRDFTFASAHQLPIRQVISPDGIEHDLPEAYTGKGILIHSGEFNGQQTQDASAAIIHWLTKQKAGAPSIHYKLRDWVFSRQRYWGEPIPIIYCEHCGVVPVPAEDLPVLLPDVESYEPTGTGESPLAGIDDWVKTQCPKCDGPAKRETNTMPQWAGSSWYFLRYIDAKNSNALADKKKLKHWLPVDLYIGGAEHAVLHLLYARFWNMVLYDEGIVPVEEPFQRLKNQGLIIGEDNHKMSKSRGNVIDPDKIIDAYGADTMRLYEMFMGPFEDAKPWSTRGIAGVHRFLHKVWHAQEKVKSVVGQDEETERLVHQAIQKVTADIEGFRFNTAIAQLMALMNHLTAREVIAKDTWDIFVRLLAPFAPHLSHELMERAGMKVDFIAEWPEADSAKAEESQVTLVVQVNGKVRAKLQIQKGKKEKEIVVAAKKNEKVAKYLAEGEVVKVIFVPEKLVNFVMK